MIQKSGVIFQFTPPVHPVPARSAGASTGNTSSALPKPLPVSNQDALLPKRFTPSNKPLSQPPQLKTPFPPLPRLGKKPSPWNDPFSSYSLKPKPSPFMQAKTLSQIAKPPEFHHGLPVEETPEIPIELPPPTIDNSYVERMFGGEVKPLRTNPESTPVLHSVEQAAAEEIREEIHRQVTKSEPPTDEAGIQNSKVENPDHSKNQPPTQKKRSPFDFLKPKFGKKQAVGVLVIALALYGLTIPVIPRLKLEARYANLQQAEAERNARLAQKPLPPSIPIGVNPMMAPDGKIIEPVNKEFSIVIPSVGINSTVIAGVNPLDSKSYQPALEKGVAHAKTSYLPGQNGATYLFSHSTNYEWYVRDLNAIFYNVKNLNPGDYIIVFYQGKRFVYEYKDKKVVKPNDTSYLVHQTGTPSLILQTCWPPGSTTERLLLFADLVQQS